MRRFITVLRRGLRTSFHLTVSYLQTNWRLFLLSLVVGLVVIYSFPQIIASVLFHKTPTVGLVGNYTVATLPLALQKEISIGLTTLTSSGQGTSGAALSWTTSNGGKTMTFNLDRNLFWQDGTKFDTSQINYNLKGVDVKRRSLYSLDFNFSEPFAPLPTIVSQPLFKTGLVGLGLNKVTAMKFNGRFLSSINLQNTQTGEPKTYKFFPTERTAATALKLGIISELPSVHQTFGLKKDSHYKVSTHNAQNTVATIFLNLRKPTLADKALRQALAYALPDGFDQGDTAISSLPQNSWVATNSVKKYTQNLKLAEENIDKVSSGGAKPKLTLTTTPELRDVAKEVAAAWSKVGISTSVALGDIHQETFDAYLTYLTLPADPDQYALWHSTQTGNIAGYKSFKSDRLLEDGRKTFDLKSRQEIYTSFERALSEDLPAIFLFYPKLYSISRSN